MAINSIIGNVFGGSSFWVRKSRVGPRKLETASPESIETASPESDASSEKYKQLDVESFKTLCRGLEEKGSMEKRNNTQHCIQTTMVLYMC